MIHIETRLQQWGAWQRAVHVDRLGYPSADLVRRSVFGGQRMAEVEDEAAAALDRAIALLHKPWPWVLVDVYVKQKTLEVIGAQFGRDASTIWRWVKKAQAALESDLGKAKGG